MLEIGRRYSFKTLTFYYKGKVTRMTPSHAFIDDTTEVYETGPNCDYFGGKAKIEEPVPNGTMVPLPGCIISPDDKILL